jgi:hypothetical protein
VTGKLPAIVGEIIPPATRKAPPKRSSLGRLSAQVEAAIANMVLGRMKRDAAAEAAGMSMSGLRKALAKPVAKQHFLRECELYRVSGQAERLHRLEEIAGQDSNQMAALGAIRAITLMEPAEPSAPFGSRAHAPGVTQGEQP